MFALVMVLILLRPAQTGLQYSFFSIPFSALYGVLWNLTSQVQITVVHHIPLVND